MIAVNDKDMNMMLFFFGCVSLEASDATMDPPAEAKWVSLLIFFEQICSSDDAGEHRSSAGAG